MTEWLVEDGIGEQRAILLEGGRVAAARLHWPGSLAPGQVEDARLAALAGGGRGTVRFAGGEEALVDRLPRSASEGATLRCEVTRAGHSERDRRKLARAVPSDAPPRPAPDLPAQLNDAAHPVRQVRRFPAGDYEDLWLSAWQGAIPFEGGELAFFDTSAMTLVDVDGTGNPAALSLRAVPVLARALRTFDIGGNIGIDFPTLPARADRRAVDEALREALRDWPHEATAMNGFGLVQLVARRARVSLLERLHRTPHAAAARFLLRRAEAVEGRGDLALTCHPAVHAQLRPAWLAELARRTGRTIRTAEDRALAPEAGFAQAVAE